MPGAGLSVSPEGRALQRQMSHTCIGSSNGPRRYMRRILRNNGLSIVLAAFFLTSWTIGQTVTGHAVYNEEQREHGSETIPFGAYLKSSHFLEATAENWES